SERHRLRPRAALVATAPPFGAAPCRVSAQNPRMNNKTVRRAMWVSIAAFGFSLTAAAQHADHEPLPPVATELHPGLGDYHFPITTSNPDAQVYFDQGIPCSTGSITTKPRATSAARPSSIRPR